MRSAFKLGPHQVLESRGLVLPKRAAHLHLTFSQTKFALTHPLRRQHSTDPKAVMEKGKVSKSAWRAAGRAARAPTRSRPTKKEKRGRTVAEKDLNTQVSNASSDKLSSF